jgi:hypothetical protein
MAIDWSKVGPKYCETEGCDHRIEFAFTPMHPWALHCGRGQYWRGCLDAAKSRNAGHVRCECPGCQPVAQVAQNLRLPKRCRCDPARIAAEVAARAEGDA